MTINHPRPLKKTNPKRTQFKPNFKGIQYGHSPIFASLSSLSRSSKRAVIEYIDPSAGKQAGIIIVARISYLVARTEDPAVAVGIVFVAFDDTICDPDYHRFTLIPVSSRA